MSTDDAIVRAMPPPKPAEVRVSVAPGAVLRVLAAIALLFGTLHLAGMPVYVEGMKAADGIHVRVARALMLHTESAIPTWFAVVLLAFNILLLVLIATAVRQARTGSPFPWLALAAVIAFLSMDEMLGLHERAGALLGRHFIARGALTFPWVVAGAIFAAAVALAFSGFLLRLPRRTARLFLISGGIYVGGALGIEVIEGATVAAIGFGGLYYLEVLVEEVMEMLGQAIFAFALLDHLGRSRTTFVLWRDPPAGRTSD